ncbi:hypothetical protein ScPMuIL_003082, partial [Solemya velum]
SLQSFVLHSGKLVRHATQIYQNTHRRESVQMSSVWGSFYSQKGHLNKYKIIYTDKNPFECNK